MADPGHATGFGVPDGHHKVRSGEDVQLAELHRLGFVQVPGRPEDREEVVVVALQLGPLVRRDGILHGELVKPELLGDGGHLVLRWDDTGRSRPCRRVPLGSQMSARGFAGGGADAVYVYGVIDDGHWLNATAWLR